MMHRSDRFAKIIRLLKTLPYVTTEQFLQATGASPATFKRDIEYLRDAFNIPIHWDKSERAYCIDPSQTTGITYDFPGLWLTVQEIQAFLVLDQLMQSLQSDLFADSFKTIKSRALAFLEEPNSSLAAILKRVRIFRHAGRHWKSEHFEKISKALVERRRILIKYYSRSKGEFNEREVSPQRLVYYRANWYLDAWCHLRNSLRSFSLDRVEAILLLESFAKDLSPSELEHEFDSGYGIFAGSGVHWAKLKFNSYRSRWIAGECWHPKQKSYQKDGEHYLEIPYTDDRELLLDILRYGPDVEVLAPPELLQKVRQAHAQAFKNYEASENEFLTQAS